MNHFNTFGFTYLVSIAALMFGFLFGGIEAALLVGLLMIVEISLSFDNAVVNAKILENWDAKWRRLFLTIGILIAVFGMRFVLPLLIVAIVANIGPIDTLNMALNYPDQYATHITDAKLTISGFGGMFLLMVAMKFFVDQTKEEHWLPMESSITHLPFWPALLLIQLFATAVAIINLQSSEFYQFFIGMLAGQCLFMVVKWTASKVAGDESKAVSNIVRQGIAGFIYIEILDASFSFDGVIASFALTNQLLIIALGLGAGAMYVRAFTILLVDTGSLKTYQYMENGAFYGILTLALIMLLEPVIHIPEIVTGLTGAAFIVTAVIHSIIENRKELANEH